MIKKISKNLGLFTASTILSLAVIKVEPTRAASFGFSFGDYGDGTLVFGKSPLKGIGLETARLSDLKSAQFDYYFIQEVVDSAVWFLDHRNLSFTFNNGHLIGLSFQDAQHYNEFFYLGQSKALIIRGIYRLKASNDHFQVSFTGSYIGYGYDYETDESFYNKDYVNNEIQSSGMIAFTTYEPIDPSQYEPIPEPLTILGTLTAIGFGTFFKRKL